jgi:uncharacterized protein
MKKLKISLLIIPVSALIYSIFFEPNHLESTFHEVTIGSGNRSLLVAHLSDLHTKGLGTIERKMMESINASKPDIIFITGDIATPGGTAKGYEDVLSKLSAPLGVYFVQGNWEYWEPVKELGQILKRAHILDLTNKVHQVNDSLWIVGYDDEFAGSPRINASNEIPKDKKIISIFHSPALFSSIFHKTDLAFAGHSHGGQVRIPLLGALWTPVGTGKYVSGWFQEGKSKLYVSRGLGNSILPIRFNCRPEIAFIKMNY